MRRPALVSFLLLLGGLMSASALRAQQRPGRVQPMRPPPSPCVMVNPTGGTVKAPLNSSGDTVTFFVQNCSASGSDEYTIGCAGDGGVQCTAAVPNDIVVAHGTDRAVQVTFSVGSSYGSVYLTADGTGDESTGWYVVSAPPAHGSPVSVTPSLATDTLFPDGELDSMAYTVRNTGSTYTDTYAIWITCTLISCPSSYNPNPAGPLTLGPGSATTVYVKFYHPSSPTTGTVRLTALDTVNLYSASGTATIVSPTVSAPIISLAPYSPDHQLEGDGVVYTHATPAVGSMGTQFSVALVYNSATARPTPIVAVDVTNPSGQLYPNWYQLQVQIVGGNLLTLANGTTSVYYVAASGSTAKTRMVAPIDARAVPNNLTTGVYAVNVIVTSIYSGKGSATTTVASRIMVNDQTQSPYGVGVSLLGIPRLYAAPPLYGMLLVIGGGGLSYFDRSCSNCAFVSPAGESGKLIDTADAQLGHIYRFRALAGGVEDFSADGRLLRTFPLASIKGRALGWTNGLLTSVTDTSGRGFTLSYPAGLLTQISDNAGRVTADTIVGGQLVRIVDPDGLRDSLGYGANSLDTLLIDRAHTRWNFTYNALNQEQSAVAPSDSAFNGVVRPTTTYVTEALTVWQPGIAGTSSSAPKGNVRPDTVVTAVTDPLGATTKMALDRFGLPVKVVDALGQVTTVTRDTLGNPTKVSGPRGHSVVSVYSSYLLSTQTDSSTGQTLQYTYNSGNQVQTVTGGTVRLDYFYHNGTGGPAGTLKESYQGDQQPSGQPPSGGLIVAQHFPNAFGQDTLVTDGLGHRTKFVYAGPSAGGNLAISIDANGDTTRFRYDTYGLADTVLEANGAMLVSIRDRMGRDSITVDAYGLRAVHNYSALGLTRLTDMYGQIYKFDLDAWGLTVGQHALSDTTKVDRLKYDAGGNVRVIQKRRNSDTITLTYDALGRALSRSGPDFPQETFRYGLNGAWMVASNSNAYDSIAYDAAGRPDSAWQRMPDGTTYLMTYAYDSHGRLVSRSAPTGGGVAGSTLRWVYNQNRDQVDTLCALGTCTAFTRDSEMKPVRVTYDDTSSAGQWSRVQVFDSLHHVTLDTFTVAQLNTDFKSMWGYNALGQLVLDSTFKAGSHATWLSYDLDGRLSNVCRVTSQYGCMGPNGLLPAYTYTPYAYGNRQGPGGPLIFWGNLATSFNGVSIGYDPNGNATNGPGGNSYNWNAIGQLMASSFQAAYSYDALGRRVVKWSWNGTQYVPATWFVYDGDQVVLDLNATTKNLITEYAFYQNGDLFGLRTPTDTAVAIATPANHTLLGLARMRGGAEIKRYDPLWTPWGDVTPDTGIIVRYRMGSQEFDQETGLYHLGARYYDPQMGRFISEDPIGIAAGLNLYAYANNDPVDGLDRSGLRAMDVPQLPRLRFHGDDSYDPFYDDGTGGGGDGSAGLDAAQGAAMSGVWGNLPVLGSDYSPHDCIGQQVGDRMIYSGANEGWPPPWVLVAAAAYLAHFFSTWNDKGPGAPPLVPPGMSEIDRRTRDDQSAPPGIQGPPAPMVWSSILAAGASWVVGQIGTVIVIIAW